MSFFGISLIEQVQFLQVSCLVPVIVTFPFMVAPEAVSDVAVIPPFTSKVFAGVAVPMPILPDEEINNLVVLFVSNSRLLAFVVPIINGLATVPVLLPPSCIS